MQIKLIEPDYCDIFDTPSRFKVVYGGRGSAKSWSIADNLIVKAFVGKTRILCTREIQKSIKDSVHKLLSDRIKALGLEWFFDIQKDKIIGKNGSEFIFAGLRSNIASIKSIEGINICWVEEAHTVSVESWDVLIPTIREEGSEIWISFNRQFEDDPVYELFVKNKQPDTQIRFVNYYDNPFFPEVLRKQMEWDRINRPDKYRHIWLGEPLQFSEAQIFKGKYIIESFDTPDGVRFYHGGDWGFSPDPTALIRSFILENTLYIDQEVYGIGIELNDIPYYFRNIESVKEQWPVIADSSRPETISYVKKHGVNIRACKKWEGCVEDGIDRLLSFDRIVVHPRCIHTADEFRLYSRKIDKVTNDILPIIIDKHNHCIDALRYGMEPVIINKGKTRVRKGF